MISKETLQLIVRHLFAEEDAQVYAILDAASIPNLLGRLQEQEPEYECLFMGDLEPGMAEVAPYLIRLERNAEFTEWLIGQGWGEHWGIFAVGEVGMKAARRHFRSFLTAYAPDGKPLFFRYYDPRVMRVYLPTCNAEELNTVFGPLQYYFLEGEDAQVAIQYRNSAGLLRQERLLLGRV
jgi:hypothetical protein